MISRMGNFANEFVNCVHLSMSETRFLNTRAAVRSRALWKDSAQSIHRNVQYALLQPSEPFPHCGFGLCACVRQVLLHLLHEARARVFLRLYTDENRRS